MNIPDINRSSKHTLHKKMKFSIKDFFSKCDQNREKWEFQEIFEQLNYHRD